MKQGWEIKQLGQICSFVRGPFGGSLKKNCFKPDGYAVYEQQHAINNQFSDIRYYVDEDKFLEMKRFELFAGDLIMSCSGTMGRTAIVPQNVKKGIINQALLKLTPSKKLEVKYLQYWMGSEIFQENISKQSKGTAIKNVASVKILKNIDIFCPPLDEQKRIVAKLDQCFEAIDQARANVERNLQNAKELFQSQLNEIFTNKGHRQGEPVEPWVEKKLKDIGETQTGSTPFTREKDNYGDFIPFVKPAHFNDDGSIDAEDSMLSKKGLKSARMFKENSILMVCIGATIGKTGFTEIPVTSNQQINSLTPQGDYEPKFFYFALLTKSFYEKVIHSSSQATLPIINKSKWENLTVSFPLKRKVQKSIVAKLEKLKDETKSLQFNYQQELDALDELKKSILQKAFNGELV